MRHQGRLVKGTFLSRQNRFLGTVRIGGEEAGCYVPNSGRLGELLRPGTDVWLRGKSSGDSHLRCSAPAGDSHLRCSAPAGDSHLRCPPHAGDRKTRWDLALARHGDILVSVDTRVVNRILPEAIRSGTIPSLRGLTLEKAEYPFLDSRLDFLARGRSGPVLLEAKSCTLVEDGLALFPDAPTGRGRRHLGALAEGVRRGMGALFVVVVQREDAAAFSPHDRRDPGFGLAFRQALAAGVRACAFTCRVGMDGITPCREIPVLCP